MAFEIWEYLARGSSRLSEKVVLEKRPILTMRGRRSRTINGFLVPQHGNFGELDISTRETNTSDLGNEGIALKTSLSLSAQTTHLKKSDHDNTKHREIVIQHLS